MKKVILAVCCLVLTAACAHSPVTVTLNPQLDVSQPTVGHGEALRVEFINGLQSSVVGSRGGVYQGSSSIGLTAGYPDVLSDRFKKGFASLGFNSWVQEQSPLEAVVTLTSLTFNSLGGGLATTYDVEVTFELQVKSATQVYKNIYSTKGQQKFASTPKADVVGEHLDKLIADTMQRLFADKAMHKIVIQ